MEGIKPRKESEEQEIHDKSIVRSAEKIIFSRQFKGNNAIL